MRKHKEIINAWADGETIQIRLNNGLWLDVSNAPSFYPQCEYRVKPSIDEEPIVDKVLNVMDWIFENAPGFDFKVE